MSLWKSRKLRFKGTLNGTKLLNYNYSNEKLTTYWDDGKIFHEHLDETEVSKRIGYYRYICDCRFKLFQNPNNKNYVLKVDTEIVATFKSFKQKDYDDNLNMVNEWLGMKWESFGNDKKGFNVNSELLFGAIKSTAEGLSTGFLNYFFPNI